MMTVAHILKELAPFTGRFPMEAMIPTLIP
jgi:hypothetical protein